MPEIRKEEDIPLLLRYKDAVKGNSKVNDDSGKDSLAIKLNKLLRKDEINRQESLKRLLDEIKSLVSGKFNFIDKLTILTEVTDENLLKVSIHLEVLKLPPPSESLTRHYTSSQ
jgi:hypothetical protein